ncbi:MAG: trimethylamine methyltransferase family protein, partial [Eubacterium sp.]
KMLRKNAYDLFLSPKDVEQIHESTLRVLKDVGVEFKHEEVLDVFRKHGARVENSIVYLDETIIDSALQTVPKTFELHGRAGYATIAVDGPPVITTAGGPPQLVHEDDSIRDSTLEDVIKFYKLIESSDVIDVTRIVSSDTSDLDRTPDNIFNPQQALLLKYNTKPVYGTIVNSNHTKGKSIRQGTRDSIQLIKKFYDVWDKNIILTDHCCISPLSVGSEVLENMLAMLDEDQIVQFTVCSMTNLTSPPSLMGTIVQDNATLLAAMVFTQLIKPGTPTIYRTLSAPTDMREVKLSIGSPENTLLGFAGVAMARFYG